MERILFVNACVRPHSRTLELAKEVLNHLEGQVENVNLEREHIAPLNNELLEKRDGLLKSKDYDHPMLRYARQFAEADTIVIAAPYWDLIFPATVRIYFEAVTVTGVTFFYTPKGFPCSLCRAKRLIYVTTAGGPVFANFGYDYVKAMAESFFGIKDTLCIKAENLDVVGADVDAILEKAKAEIAEVI